MAPNHLVGAWLAPECKSFEILCVLQSPTKKRKKGLELHVRLEIRDSSLGTKNNLISTLGCLIALNGFIFAYKLN